MTVSNKTPLQETVSAAKRSCISAIPVRAGGTKQPAVKWKPFMSKLPTTDELREWFTDTDFGLALICGKVSSGLECLDFDNRKSYDSFKELAHSTGLGSLVDRIEHGYLEESPNGMHWLWRCEDFGPNTVLARRKDTSTAGTAQLETVIETRGQGGYVIVAPSGAGVHPSGKPYKLLRGGLATIANLTPEERESLFDLARSLDDQHPSEYVPPEVYSTPDGDRPGDHFNRTKTWEEVLTPHGWTTVRTEGQKTYWRRPGKTQGVSATTNHHGRDLLHVFSTSTELEADKSYTKFTVHALLNHNADFAAAARELASNVAGGTMSGQRGNSEGDKLFAVAMDTYKVGKTPDRRLFVVPRSTEQGALLLDGQENQVRSELTEAYARKNGITPTDAALKTVLRRLEGQAYANEHPTQLQLRTAQAEGSIWLDLADDHGHVVRVGQDGWTVEEQAPVTFRRTTLTGALPRPREGDLQDLRPLLNLTDEDWDLTVGWLVSAIYPDIPHPVLMLTGEQGTAKSTTARMLVQLLDPPATLQAPPAKQDDWATMANASSVVAMDNLSSVPAWLQDDICRAVTGGGFAKRQLYTNDGIHQMSFQRTVLLTGIDMGIVRGDLLERAIRLELRPIDESARRTESELQSRFSELKPHLLGGLLDLTARVLQLRDSVAVENVGLPRMADHARVLTALDTAYGWNTLEAYKESISRTMGESALDDPVGAAVLELVQDHGPWDGPASELLDLMQSKGWPGVPSTPQALSTRLTKLGPSLRRKGVKFERSGNGHGRKITLQYTTEDTAA